MNAYTRIPADPADWFSPEEVEKAKDYQRPLTRVRLVNGFINLAALVLVVQTNAAPRIADALGVTAWPLRLLLVLGGLLLLTTLLDLPTDLWTEFRHEKHWGFSTQTPGGFVSDLVKGLAVGLVITGGLLMALWALIRATDMWWVVGWIVFLLFSVVLGALGHVVIMPLFNKFTPLEDESLAERLRALVRSVGKDVKDVEVMDASKRTRHDNAFFAGLGKTRKIVLFDNLLSYEPNEIETVVAHELGHWRRRHMPRSLLLGTVTSLVMFLLLRAVATNDAVLDWAGVATFADPAAVPLMILTFGGASFVLGYVSAWHTRALEREADIHALEVTKDVEGFQGMMRRMTTRNLADVAPSRLAYIKRSHPPPAERLQLAANWSSQGA